jgi:AraC-like DNA-binding protein
VFSYWATGVVIPGELSERWLWPLLNACIATFCFFGAWLCLKHNDDNRTRIAWAVALLLWGLLEVVLVTGVVLYDIPFVKPGTEALTGNAMIVGCLFAWILFIYPLEALQPGHFVWWRSMLQLLPLPVMAILEYLLPIDLRLLIALYPLWLLGILIVQIRKYRQWCEDNFSTMDNIDAQWIMRYIVMLVIAGGSFFWLCISQDPSRVLTQDLYLFYMIAYTTERVLYRPDPWKQLRSTVMDEQEEVNPVNATYRATLEAWLDKEKPYLNPDFQLTDLRQVLPLNRTYLSQLINTEYGCTFYQFVNRRRIDEAKRMKIEHPDWTIQEICQRCGFSSPRVFYRTFARETGMTPKEWWFNRGDNS